MDVPALFEVVSPTGYTKVPPPPPPPPHPGVREGRLDFSVYSEKSKEVAKVQGGVSIILGRGYKVTLV